MIANKVYKTKLIILNKEQHKYHKTVNYKNEQKTQQHPNKQKNTTLIKHLIYKS